MPTTPYNIGRPVLVPPAHQPEVFYCAPKKPGGGSSAGQRHTDTTAGGEPRVSVHTPDQPAPHVIIPNPREVAAQWRPGSGPGTVTISSTEAIGLIGDYGKLQNLEDRKRKLVELAKKIPPSSYLEWIAAFTQCHGADTAFDQIKDEITEILSASNPKLSEARYILEEIIVVIMSEDYLTHKLSELIKITEQNPTMPIDLIQLLSDVYSELDSEECRGNVKTLDQLTNLALAFWRVIYKRPLGEQIIIANELAKLDPETLFSDERYWEIFKDTRTERSTDDRQTLEFMFQYTEPALSHEAKAIFASVVGSRTAIFKEYEPETERGDFFFYVSQIETISNPTKCASWLGRIGQNSNMTATKLNVLLKKIRTLSVKNSPRQNVIGIALARIIGNPAYSQYPDATPQKNRERQIQQRRAAVFELMDLTWTSYRQFNKALITLLGHEEGKTSDRDSDLAEFRRTLLPGKLIRLGCSCDSDGIPNNEQAKNKLHLLIPAEWRSWNSSTSPDLETRVVKEHTWQFSQIWESFIRELKASEASR